MGSVAKNTMKGSYFQEANQLYRSGRLEEAVEMYRKAIAQNPNIYIYHHNLGEALEKLGRFQEATAAYQEAVKLNPKATWYQSSLKIILETPKTGKLTTETGHKPPLNVINKVTQEQPDRKPLLSVLTVSRTAENVNQLLDSISRNVELDLGEIEVLCSWNGSAEEEKNILVPSGIEFKIIDRSPYHFASNMNTLAGKAAADNLCIANDDVKLRPETLGNGLKWLNYSNVGMVGSILLFPNGKIQHCGIGFKPDKTPFHLDKGLHLHESPCLHSPRAVEACTGALFFVKKAIYNSIKMIESFKECGEDICFSLDLTSRTGLSIIVPNDVIAEHKEGHTRGKLGKQGTPETDLAKIRDHVAKHLRKKPSVLIETEEKGWIFYRKAEEIQKNLLGYDVTINEPTQSPDIIYFIHYARYNQEKAKGKCAVANFTHFVPGTNAEPLFRDVAHKIDYCIAISQSTKRDLLSLGVPEDKISVVEVGAAKEFNPKIVLGIVGRVYNDGRKGEDLVKKLSVDPDISSVAELVSMDDCWGVKTVKVDSHSLFYSLIDYLLVPSRVEGGPVPFMEALACGKLSIAPPIGVIPSFPHIPYDTGDYESMKRVILQTAQDRIIRLQGVAKYIKDKNWERWAFEHHLIFDSLLRSKAQKDFTENILGKAKNVVFA
jgi:tetratricopeptide (TPR) repeat protein